ncbi:MAG: class I SAM-dependent methyltransferase [Caulobacterales bacterium]
MRLWLNGVAAVAAVLVVGCASGTGGADQPVAPMAAVEARAAIEAATANPARPAEQVTRDAQRHPAASLAFWGLEPGMDILEIQPGGEAWWTHILAPFARDTGGRYSVTAADLNNPNLSEAARQGRATWEARFVTPGQLGPISLVNWGLVATPPLADSYDFILTSRSVHGWIGANMVDKAFGDMFTALRPGGILAVEQHRANADVTDPAAMAASGYVSEAFVIAAAERAGFRLAGRSEINANPRDTKDHPFGVWTLPPVRRSAAAGAPENPNFDHAPYDAIGESDRMTLRFVKPS